MKNKERSELMDMMNRMSPKPRILEVCHKTFSKLSDDDIEAVEYIYGTKIVKKEIKDAGKKDAN